LKLVAQPDDLVLLAADVLARWISSSRSSATRSSVATMPRAFSIIASSSPRRPAMASALERPGKPTISR
jgi:hypothetical protein